MKFPEGVINLLLFLDLSLPYSKLSPPAPTTTNYSITSQLKWAISGRERKAERGERERKYFAAAAFSGGATTKGIGTTE